MRMGCIAQYRLILHHSPQNQNNEAFATSLNASHQSYFQEGLPAQNTGIDLQMNIGDAQQRTVPGTNQMIEVEPSRLATMRNVRRKIGTQTVSAQFNILL